MSPFLVIAPLVLTALSFYLHIFVGYWVSLSRQRPIPSNPNERHPILPFVFNLESKTSIQVSNFLFYWLVPLMLGIFAWKALPRPEGPALVTIASLFVAVFLFLRLRRRPAQTLVLSSSAFWLMLFASILFAFRASCGGRLRRRLELEGTNFEKQSLQYVDLTGADLVDSKLNGANLTGANLTRAHLTRANLDGANLTRANLDGANLNGANLADATLTRAYLDGANLDGANLTCANLTRAHLTYAYLIDVNMADADLSKVLGLSQQQVDEAVGNQATTLPTGITRPESWDKPWLRNKPWLRK